MRGSGGAMAKLIDREWTSKAPRLTHVKPFDGIRGFGVIGVMLGHSLPFATKSFSAIVDVFFVISGFLITTLLLQEHRDTQRVDVRKFYARRLLRLLPALYAMLAGTVVIAVIIKQVEDPAKLIAKGQTLSALAKEMGAAFFYVHNLVYPANNGPWIDHLWTLSIEEQFYLIIGVVALLFIAKGRIKIVTGMLIGLVALIQVSRLFLVAGPAGRAAGAVWIQRPDSLMVGMLGAIASAYLADPIAAKVKQRLSIAGYISIPVLFFSVWASTGAMRTLGWHHEYLPIDSRGKEILSDYLARGVRPPGFYWIQWGNTAAVWSMVIITICAFRVPEWLPNRFLSIKAWVWTGGLLSYSLYLWHVPVQELMRALAPSLETDYRPIWVVLAVLMPFVVAYPSYRFVETRAIKIKNRFAVRQPDPVTATTDAP